MKFVVRNVSEVGRNSTDQYCTQQFQGWKHNAIEPLHAILRTILHRVSGPLWMFMLDL